MAFAKYYFCKNFNVLVLNIFQTMLYFYFTSFLLCCLAICFQSLSSHSSLFLLSPPLPSPPLPSPPLPSPFPPLLQFAQTLKDFMDKQGMKGFKVKFVTVVSYPGLLCINVVSFPDRIFRACPPEKRVW